MHKCPNFIMHTGFRTFCQSYLQKNMKGGSDKYVIWCVEQLDRDKKAQNSIFSDQPFMEQISSKFLLPFVSSNRYLANIFFSHIQLVLNIFVTPSALDWRDAFSGPRLWSWPYLQENSWCTVACMLLQSRKAGVKRWFFFGNNFLETIYSFWGRRCQVRFK